MLAIGRIRFWASSLPPDRCSLPQALPLQFPNGVCFFAGGGGYCQSEAPFHLPAQAPDPRPRGSLLGAGAQAEHTVWPASYPPRQIRPRGSLWFAMLKLQLEKDPTSPWQMIWFLGLLKSGKWAKATASPQDSRRQRFEACLGSSQWFGFFPQLRLDTVCHGLLFLKETSSWPWQWELELVSLTRSPGGQRGVCGWVRMGRALRGGPLTAFTPPGSHAQPGCLLTTPSPPRAACLDPGSSVLWGAAGTSHTLGRSPETGPQRMGLETSEPTGARNGRFSAPVLQQDRPTPANSVSIEIGPGTRFDFSFKSIL